MRPSPRRPAADISEAEARAALQRLDPLWDELLPAEQARIVALLVKRVDIGAGAGQEFAHCCLNARLRDLARFGRLYPEGGARDGVPIVPADRNAASVNPAAPHPQPRDIPASGRTFGFGCHWWIPEDPQGDFLAIGVWGQYIRIGPVREVIIVKTCADPDFDDNDHESVAAFRAIAQAVATD